MVVIVWDGMRPDFVNAATTPTMARLARQGETFMNHHPAYLSTTEANGAALATGDYPDESGIIGNKEFRPAIDPSKRIQTASVTAVRKGDELTGGHYLGAPTPANVPGLDTLAPTRPPIRSAEVGRTGPVRPPRFPPSSERVAAQAPARKGTVRPIFRPRAADWPSAMRNPAIAPAGGSKESRAHRSVHNVSRGSRA